MQPAVLLVMNAARNTVDWRLVIQRVRMGSAEIYTD